MTRHEASPYATVMDDSQLTGRPIVARGAGPYGGDLEVAEPLVTGGKKWADVDRDICMHAEQFPTTRWWIAFGVALAFLSLLGFALVTLFYAGMGIARRQPAGRLGLVHHQLRLLDRHRPRRHADLGRALPVPPAVAHRHQPRGRGDDALRGGLRGHLPDHPPRAGRGSPTGSSRIPNARGPLWVNFNSPLAWDIFAISTYGLVSLTFWYMGLLPDLATVRDRATHPWRKALYNAMSFGWTGSHRAWRHYESAYMVLAALATPLVFSVHTIVSFDFATSVMPGWHTTIFPPYFVIGAIFSGFAMVITLMTFMRGYFGMKHYITLNHMEAMAKILHAHRHAGRLRLLDRVLHGVVLGQRVGGLHLQEPRVRPVLVGLRDHVHLQRDRARRCSGSRRCGATPGCSSSCRSS